MAEEQTENTNIEVTAKEMGWRPKEEFNGDPEQWRDAAEFVRRGNEILPFVRADRDRARAEKAELTDKLEKIEREGKKATKRMEHMYQVALDQQREEIIAKYEARKEQAVERGDTDAYRKVSQQQSEAVQKFDEKAKEPEEFRQPADNLPDSVRKSIEIWMIKNPWYKSDPEMSVLGEARHKKLLAEKPGMTIDENLDAVTDFVRSKFPERFADQESSKNAGSRVEGGGDRSPASGGKSLWSKLPADVKATGDRFIKEGLFQRNDQGKKDDDKGRARERYAREYLGEE